MAPLWPALALYGFAWVSAQLLGHAVFPRARLEYADSGGELGRVVSSPRSPSARSSSAASVPRTRVAAADGAPARHVQGPLVIRHAGTLVGGTVRGGMIIRADHVTMRNVTVVGGENGILIEHATT